MVSTRTCGATTDADGAAVAVVAAAAAAVRQYQTTGRLEGGCRLRGEVE